MEGAGLAGDAAIPMAADPATPIVDVGATTIAESSNAVAAKGSQVADDKVMEGAAPRRVEISEEQREKIVSLAKEAEEKGLAGSSDLWPYVQTMLLIEIWGQIFVAHNHVNLKARHWKAVLEELNKQVQLSIPGAKIYSLQQAQDRIELLKRNHKKEAEKKTATGGVASKWAFFHAMNDILGTSSKVTGVPGAFTGQRAVPVEAAKGSLTGEAQGKEGTIDLESSAKQTIDLEVETQDLQGTNAKPPAKRRRSEDQPAQVAEEGGTPGADLPASAKRAASLSTGKKSKETEMGGDVQEGESAGPVKKERGGDEDKQSRKVSKSGVKGQFTRASGNRAGASPGTAAAKALMGGLKECVTAAEMGCVVDSARRNAADVPEEVVHSAHTLEEQ
ncbi:hypothetical protein KFL_006620010 [Klebsormidium nitens]|uniref:Myb/SANT-like DNA-binding domain-containing protein n=1 Tax=Klebsormidium nitens TaxID=105231 RepID=A0A1Y1IP98_KLENI|nr:hypothetical protein KFL_006620010 [Klebsormidium nitens]|eukprot:GAQ90606.1 hypothetical protein KFL_006620010 [Klebsormidium nitens]